MRTFTILIFVFLSMTLFSQTQSLNLSSDVWPPFTDVNEEKSLALDIVEEALARDSIVVNYIILEFDEVMEKIKNGESDGSAALWKSEKREEMMLFSNAYLENQLILVGRKGSDVDVTSFDEMKDTRIGVVEDYAYGDELEGGENNQVIYGESDQQNLERLLSMQVDYILVDALLIQYMLKYQINDVTELLEIGEVPLISKSLHLAIRNDVQDAESIIENFNKAITTMIADGSYNEILELNWIRADVDGDGELELILAGDKAGTTAPDNTYNIQYSDPAARSDRYYVDGKMYNSWSEVPNQYKVPTPNISTDPEQNDATMKIKF